MSEIESGEGVLGGMENGLSFFEGARMTFEWVKMMWLEH